MKKKYNPEDYIYACARARALETGIVGGDHCARLAELKSAAEFFRALEEYGIHTQIKPVEGDETVSEAAVLDDLEVALTDILSDVFSIITQIAPQPKLFDFFRYPYDCHNLKSALKSSLRGTEPDKLLFPFGSVDTAAAVAVASQREELAAQRLLPPHMAAALGEAAELFSKTGDPQLIDVTLDRACYADMMDLAKTYGCEFFFRLAETKVDITNLLTAIRMLRMKGAHINFGFFNRMSLEKSKLDENFFAPAFDTETDAAEQREEELIMRLRHTPYAPLADMLLSARHRPSLAFVEKQCDDFYLDIVKSAKNVLYGPEPLGAYIVAREYEVRNLRIVAAGKLSGLRAETIKERLRSSYV